MSDDMTTDPVTDVMPDETPAEELGYGPEEATSPTTDPVTDQTADPAAAPADLPKPAFTGVSEELANERLETKRKTFFIDLKRNERGLFIKISERSGGRRSTVMIPYEYIEDFAQKIGNLRAAGPDPKTVQSE